MSTHHEPVPAGSVSIRDQLAVIGRHWRLVVAFFAIGGLLSVAYIHAKPITYRATAQVQVKPVTTSQFAAQNTSQLNSVSMPTEQNIASSIAVADLAAKRLPNGLTGTQARSHLTVSVPASTVILQFGYTASTPRAAQLGADAFAQAYIANRRATNQAAVASTRVGLRAQRASILKRQRAVESALAATNDIARRASLQGQISSLNQRLNPISTALTALSQVDPTAATVAQQASLPTKPAGTAHSILLVAGLLAGLVLGLIAAFIREATDDRVHGPGDLAAVIGAPVLARIPQIRSARSWRRHEERGTGTTHPKAAEAYRLLANRLVVAASKENLSSILIASPAKGEGRSSVAANVSASFVDLGCRVWLVSADLLPPQVHRLFSPEEAESVVSVEPIADVLPTRATSELAVTVGAPDSDAPHGHLTLSMSGGVVRREGRLLNPIVLANEVRANRHNVDITVIDAPALLEFADAVPLLPVVDGVIVVADAGTTKRTDLAELSEMLEDTGARILGGVLNRDSSWVVSRRARRARSRLDRHRPAPTAATHGRSAPPSPPPAASEASVPPAPGPQQVWNDREVDSDPPAAAPRERTEETATPTGHGWTGPQDAFGANEELPLEPDGLGWPSEVSVPPPSPADSIERND